MKYNNVFNPRECHDGCHKKDKEYCHACAPPSLLEKMLPNLKFVDATKCEDTDEEMWEGSRTSEEEKAGNPNER